MTDIFKVTAHFDDGYFEHMPDGSWRWLSAGETAATRARSDARVAAYTAAGPGGSLQAGSRRLNDTILTSLAAGFCIGVLATIIAYSLGWLP